MLDQVASTVVAAESPVVDARHPSGFAPPPNGTLILFPESNKETHLEAYTSIVSQRMLPRQTSLSATTEREIDETRARLSATHRELVAKKFSGGMTRLDARRLDMVRWEMDQLEQRKYPSQGSMLSVAIRENRLLAAQIESLVSAIERNSKMQVRKSPV